MNDQFSSMPSVISFLRDPERLQVIRDCVLPDTLPEASLDRITRLTAACLQTELAFIHIIDDQQQWAKSCFAPPEWTGEPTTSLADSLCKFVVATRQPLVIDDTRTHPWVAASALVEEQGILAYASAPLISYDGFVLGTLCVADRQPREWQVHEIEHLTDLAQLVITEIELRRDVQRRTQLEAELRAQQESVVLLQQVAVAANEATTFIEATKAALGIVCENTRWDVGHAYRVLDGDVYTLEAWCGTLPLPTAMVRQLMLNQEWEPGSGIPGHVVKTGDVYWCNNIALDPVLLRKQYAASGIRSVLAFPVLAGSEVVGVLEFFSTKVESINAAMIKTMKSIGTQIGRVVERERYQNSLRAEALVDAVTGLLNRRGFMLNAEQALQASNQQGNPCGLFYIDLDRMKRINDTWGHAAGDQALQLTALVLQQTFRTTDCLARLGGDEFVVLARDCTPEQQAMLVERLYVSIDAVSQQHSFPFSLTMSVGVVSSDPAMPESIDMLLERADVQMYANKRLRIS